MAKDLRNKPNTEPGAGIYPYGQIKDETANQDGTPVDKEVYQDLHIFFQKLMDEAGITFNGYFENEDDGYQFWEAFIKLAYETRGSTLDIQFDSLNNGEKIVLPDRVNQVYDVTDSGGAGALQAIEPSSQAQSGDFVVLFFPAGITIGEFGWSDPGNSIQTPENFDSLSGPPYVFRYDGFRWYPESSFYHLSNEKANRNQEQWTLISNFQSPWGDSSNVDEYSPSFMKDELGFVHLRGWIGAGANGNDLDTIANLPSGYRPGASESFPAAGTVASDARVIDIKDDGDIVIKFSSPNDDVSLSGITFKAQ